MAPIPLFLTAFVVGFSGAMTPGPVSTVTLTQSMRRGFWVGPLITAGHALVEGPLVVALAFGLGGPLRRPEIMAAIGCVGGLVLLWMGSSLILHGWREGGEQTSDSEASSYLAGGMSSVPAGMVTSVANPYWFLWWATVGAKYVFDGLEWGVVGLVAFYSGHILSDLSWNSLLALAGTTGRRLLSGRLHLVLSLICGLFLLGLGGYFLWAGMRFWTGVPS
ncbi:MAG: LysE family transporter [Chloroflexota bacterium]|nr:LysE family transporter [Chloroflexota bacterium]